MNPGAKSPAAASRLVPERQNFKFPLATNPTYFGNLEASPYRDTRMQHPIRSVGDKNNKEVITRGVHR
jgi:hypothetical protein